LRRALPQAAIDIVPVGAAISVHAGPGAVVVSLLQG